MMGIKSVNGLRIENVRCSNHLKTSTENTAIFINVIHGALRAAVFLSFLFSFLGGSEVLCFTGPQLDSFI